MRWARAWVVGGTSLLACSRAAVPSPPTTAPAADESGALSMRPSVPSDAPKPTCATLVTRASELAGEEVEHEEPIEAVDFDGDGREDCVFYGYKTAFLFARVSEHDLRFLGDVPVEPVFGIACMPGDAPGGYCLVLGTQLMIHGEALTREYAFDGSRYVSTGESSMTEPLHGP